MNRQEESLEAMQRGWWPRWDYGGDCSIAQNYMKAADEADELAREHRAMRPRGMVQ